MSGSNHFQGLLKDPEVRLAFEQEWLLQEFLTQLEDHMRSQHITRSELARRMGVSAASVTQAMRADGNLTMHTMVHMAQAAGLRICLTLASLDRLAAPVRIPWMPWNIVFCDDPQAASANDQDAEPWPTVVAQTGHTSITLSDEGPEVSKDPWCPSGAEALAHAA